MTKKAGNFLPAFFVPNAPSVPVNLDLRQQGQICIENRVN